MTPTELRRAAESLKRLSSDSLTALADHVLSTVREDDGEAITGDWLRSLSHVQGKFFGDIIIGPVVRMIVRNAQSPSNSRWDWCVGSYQIPEEHKPRTRGQLRRLLEGLGVD